MKLEDAILSINLKNENEHLYKRFIEYSNYKCLDKAWTVGGLQEDIRDVFVHCLNPNKSKTDKVLLRLLDKEISKYFLHYKAIFSRCSPQKIVEVQLLKYIPGGKYEPHVDSVWSTSRQLTCIINLNSDFKGGDFVFWDPKVKEPIKRVKNEKGTVIFFPSNYMYPHQVEPITEGTRYSLVIWLA